MKRFYYINEDEKEEFDSNSALEAYNNNDLTTVNSVSGGKTSSYLATHYPADINIFALVRIEDKDNLWMKGRDEKTRQLVSDKIGKEFIGTAEMDMIIYTMLDLEQHTGREITWISGPTFEEVIRKHGDYLPNMMARYCTSEMKIIPIFKYLKKHTDFPVEMRIGYRQETNDYNRMLNMKSKADSYGIEYFKTVIGKSKTGNQNRWGEIPYRIAKFPLIEDRITKDVIHAYWENHKVRFAYRNNCVGCVNRNELFLSHMYNKDPDTFKWFEKQEKKTGNTFNSKFTYSEIMKFGEQKRFFDEDFSECDSGYCGI